MKFDLKDAPIIDNEVLQVGNIYSCKGGRNSNHKFWVVVALTDNSVVMLGIDQEGNIISSANYGRHVFDCSSQYFTRGRERIGIVVDMPELTFNVKWELL